MKVFVVEDSAAVRERLIEMIREIEDVDVVGEAATYDTAVDGIMNTRPDVAVLDIKLADDGGSGIDVLNQVRKGLPAMKAIVLSNYATPQHMKASADAGAEYFLDKSADFERITEILEQMKSGTSDRLTRLFQFKQAHIQETTMLQRIALIPADPRHAREHPQRQRRAAHAASGPRDGVFVVLPEGRVPAVRSRAARARPLRRDRHRQAARARAAHRSTTTETASIRSTRSAAAPSRRWASRATATRRSRVSICRENCWGWTRSVTSRYGYSAVALEDSEVCVLPFGALERMAMSMPALQHQLLRLISGDISRDHGLMLLLGSMTAEQRLAAFLLSLSRRHQRLGFSGSRFVLRMTREEIGNYLGLTLETVSRLLSRFQREGLLAVQQRDVEIRNTDRLMEMVGHW